MILRWKVDVCVCVDVCVMSRSTPEVGFGGGERDGSVTPQSVFSRLYDEFKVTTMDRELATLFFESSMRSQRLDPIPLPLAPVELPV